MGLCKNCKFWLNGECIKVDHHDEGFGWGQNPATQFEVDVEINVDDNSGLYYSYKLITGPEFGCVKFENKVSDLGD